jgi:hypothetical protein
VQEEEGTGGWGAAWRWRSARLCIRGAGAAMRRGSRAWWWAGGGDLARWSPEGEGVPRGGELGGGAAPAAAGETRGLTAAMAGTTSTPWRAVRWRSRRGASFAWSCGTRAPAPWGRCLTRATPSPPPLLSYALLGKGADEQRRLDAHARLALCHSRPPP